MEEKENAAFGRVADALTRLADLYESDIRQREAEREVKAQDRADLRDRMRAMDIQMKGFGPMSKLMGPLSSVLMLCTLAFLIYSMFVRP